MGEEIYIGHESQIYGIEEHRLVGGKGDGMRLLEVRNGCGLHFTVSLDRCADISRLEYEGVNVGYFSPCGYVAPTYYDRMGEGFLRSFTAGFLTTCGLSSVGASCKDEGKEYPMHGEISNCPSDWCAWEVNQDRLTIKAKVNQMRLFDDKLVLHRVIQCSKRKNEITIEDSVENIGSKKCPVMILYHMNIGFPLLNENSQLEIPSICVSPRDKDAEKGIEEWNKMSCPTIDYAEQCFYHHFSNRGEAILYNPTLDKGIKISFDTKELNYFTEWKMMGEKEYVLGLEPGNCHVDGRRAMRQENKLSFIKPGEKRSYHLTISFFSNNEQREA